MLSNIEQRQTVVAPPTHAVQPRSMRFQTSGSEYCGTAILIHTDLCCTVFKFPLELFLEVFSYLADHRRFIRENYYGRELKGIGREHAERSVVIRRLTMTCWPLRNLLLPLLWTDAEGCISHSRYNYNTNTGGLGSNPYDQCIYLASTPAIAVHIQRVCSYLLQLTIAHKQ